MNNRMCHLNILVVLSLVSLVAAPTAHAMKVELFLTSLAAGGNTIGGPGIFQKAVGNSVTVGEYFLAAQNICVTLTTVNGWISIELFDANGVEITSNVFIFPETTGSECGESVSNANLTCHPGGGDCVGVWRIDKQ